MALTPQEVQNAGGLSTVEGMRNSDLAPFAAEAFQYDQFHRVTQVTVNGLHTYTYSYTPDIGGIGVDANAWQNETVENRPDGSLYTIYTNNVGETLLTDLADTSTGQHWVNDTSTGPNLTTSASSSRLPTPRPSICRSSAAKGNTATIRARLTWTSIPIPARPSCTATTTILNDGGREHPRRGYGLPGVRDPL